MPYDLHNYLDDCAEQFGMQHQKARMVEQIVETWGKISIVKSCPFCGKKNKVIVNTVDFESFQNGELAQKAFPDLSADEREILITGICCWDEALKDIED